MWNLEDCLAFKRVDFQPLALTNLIESVIEQYRLDGHDFFGLVIFGLVIQLVRRYYLLHAYCTCAAGS